MQLGRYRVDFQRFGGYGFAVRRGGGATEWPWVEVAVPRVGSLRLSRSRPRVRKDG